jgi:hypothetical protein
MVTQLDLFVKRCGGCNRELVPAAGRGQPRRYCNDACQQRAYRKRKRNAGCYDIKPAIDLIYCAGGNPRLSEIAQQEGWQLGFRSTESMGNFKVVFIDNHYRKLDFEKHLRVVAKHKPKYATVPDLSEEDVSEQDVERAMRQYEQLANYCQIPLIIPKLPGQIAMLPQEVAIGYSIPTNYGGAQYPLWELEGRRIHLLGGSPHEQMDIYQELSLVATVMSADGNMANKMATQFAKYWRNSSWIVHPGRKENGKDLYFECWRWSCANILAAWKRIAAVGEGNG